MYKLYDSRLSGNAWKIRVLMRQLDLPFERITLDLAAGDATRPEFAKISRFKRVPVLELEDGRHLIESASIMAFLAEGTDLLPADSFVRAEIMSWLFFEQADLLKPLAMARFFHMRGFLEEKAADLRLYHEIGYAGLNKLEDWIAPRRWLVNDAYSLADIGIFPYVAMAEEGGYGMKRYPGIVAWLSRLKAKPGWEPIVPKGNQG